MHYLHLHGLWCPQQTCTAPHFITTRRGSIPCFSDMELCSGPRAMERGRYRISAAYLVGRNVHDSPRFSTFHPRSVMMIVTLGSAYPSLCRASASDASVFITTRRAARRRPYHLAGSGFPRSPPFALSRSRNNASERERRAYELGVPWWISSLRLNCPFSSILIRSKSVFCCRFSVSMLALSSRFCSSR